MIWKRLLVAFAWIALAMTATVGLLWVFQRSLIYLPEGSVPQPPSNVEEVTYETDDGLVLDAWYMKSHSARAAVIVFNGNAGNRSHRLPLGRALVERGFAVLLTDYRGFGGNPGSPSEEGLASDAMAALGYMRERSRDLPVVYYGESLGAGVAIGLATETPPSALILRSPFSSLPAVAAVHYWWLPSSLLLKDRYPNLERVADVPAPVLVIAGSADAIVPSDQSRAVYEAATEPKELLIVEGAGHNDAALLDGSEMTDSIREFLGREIDR